MKITKEAKIGISTIIVLFATYWGINFLKGLNIFDQRNQYYMSIDEATGMEVSTPVYVRGVKIGSITAINLESIKSKILIELTISAKYDIPSDSYLHLEEGAIMDAPKLKLVPGVADTYFNEGDTLSFRFKPTMMQTFNIISDKLFVILDRVDTLMASTNKVLSPENINSLSTTMKNLESATNSANDLIVSQKAKLNRIMTNFDNISKTISEATPELKQTLSNFHLMSNDLKLTIPEAVENINTVLKKVNSKDGSVGKLLNDESLYNNLDTTLVNISTLLDDLKANPKKYVRFSVFEKRTYEEKLKDKQDKKKYKQDKKALKNK